MTCRNYIPGPNGDCQRCGEMRAGHAGFASEIETLFDRVLNGMRMDAPPGAVPALYRLREIAMRAGHAGGAMHDRAMSLPTLEDLRSVVSLPQDNDTHISNLEKMYTEAREIIIGLL